MNTGKINEIENRLREYEERLSKLESAFQSRPLSEDIASGRNKELAKRINVDEEKLNQLLDKLFHIEKENILTVIEPSEKLGKNDKERTKNITLLTLLGYKYFFGKDEIFSQEIRRNVAENNVPLNNFGSYLNELVPSFIRRKGKLKSPKTTYKLTVLGKSKARELIKKLCGKN